MTLLATLLLSIVPVQIEPVQDRCDVLELSHYYDGDGREVFSQVVFWDYDGDGRQAVRAWRLWKGPAQTPWLDHGTGEYVALWFDGDLMREVRARSYRESWLQNDVELDNREFYPVHERRGLSREKPPPRPVWNLTP